MDFTQRSQKADLSFAILSDLHMTHRGEGLQKLSQYMALFSKVTPKIDAHVFAGDIVYQIDLSGGGTCETLYHEPYDYLNAAIARYAPDTPVLYAIGNHEYPQHNPGPVITKAARALWEEKMGMPLRLHREINGYHFIVVDIADYRCVVGEEAEKWAMKEIRRALAASEDKPVFVVYHPPVQNTVEGSRGACHSRKFAKFLLSNRRIFNICGHLHDPAQSPCAIWQRRNGATMLHAPMSAVGYVNVRRSRAVHLPKLDSSQALYVEVFGSRVLVHKIDILEGKELGEPWEIDVHGEQYYTDSRIRASRTPAFPVGAKIKAKEAPGGVAFTFPKAYTPVTPHNDDAEVPYYRFTFFRKGEDTPVETLVWHADFYAADPAPTFADTVKVSLPIGEYRVKVQPISYFGKVGRGLFAHVTVKACEPAPALRLEDPDLFPIL